MNLNIYSKKKTPQKPFLSSQGYHGLTITQAEHLKTFKVTQFFILEKAFDYLEGQRTSSSQKSPQTMMNSEYEALVNGRKGVLTP